MDLRTQLRHTGSAIEASRRVLEAALPARDDAIERALRAGISGEEIAVLAGVSSRRVRQIALRAGIPLQRGRPRKQEAAE